VESDALVPLLRAAAPIPCPYCDARDTERRSEFGSTACKAIWYCNACRQPFEEFKAI
jgi:ring-1,2-phenylacetyl-CoA epoxidase subunit PaaD